MADIQTPQTVDKLRRQYKSRDLGGLNLAEELVPVTIVDDLSGSGLASRNYPRECQGETGSPAVALEVGEHFWIPSALPVISRLDRIIISSAGNLGYAMVIAPEAGAGVSGLTDSALKSFTDLRVADQTPNDFIQQRTVVPASTQGNVIGFFRQLTNTPAIIPIGAVGHFGGAYGIVCDTVALAFTVTWWWTEYLLAED